MIFFVLGLRSGSSCCWLLFFVILSYCLLLGILLCIFGCLHQVHNGYQVFLYAGLAYFGLLRLLLLLSVCGLLGWLLLDRHFLLLLTRRRFLFLIDGRGGPSEVGHLSVSLALVLADLEHHFNGVLVALIERELVLVADEGAIVGELPDRLLHRRGELVIVVEAGLNQLRRLLKSDLPSAVSDHLVEELQAVLRWEILLREGAVREVVQIVLCEVTAREQVLVSVDLRLVVQELG